ncbi:hypothetical protein CISG_05166 [Coccidioides immitis RMSCC 3703]|uniref:Uncharacterized protein n=1 Tax=Coccidioides immitis RMSCC 3703 TaxID=454286 RepID=A0A0J8QSJ6_COCIT|nr:hypothetical protein CISG_05166 [Coccidioides immitis RMSCC 3703]
MTASWRTGFVQRSRFSICSMLQASCILWMGYGKQNGSSSNGQCPSSRQAFRRDNTS